MITVTAPHEPAQVLRPLVVLPVGITDGPPGQWVLQPSVFLAGGITDCPPWQWDLIALLENEPGMLFNPRRREWPSGADVQEVIRQIEWEHHWLHQADIVSFWFCRATLCPIVLYELGAAAERQQRMVVGVEPGYQRELDVVTQLRLQRPEVEVVSSLEALAAQMQAAPSGEGSDTDE